MKLGIYVGSFNPVHKGHKYIMDYLINNKYLDKIIVIATKNYWDKDNLIDIDKRIDMLKFYQNKNIIINDSLNSIKYTYQVLDELKKEYKKDELYLIIGADNIPKFHLWKNINKILENKIIVLPRDNLNVEEYINKFNSKDKFILISNFNSIDISSTMMRGMIKNNDKNINKHLDNKIIEYIYKNKLYK